MQQIHRTVIVAMAFMRMMKVAFHQVVGVTAVGHRFMATARPVHVSRSVPPAFVRGCADIRVLRANLEHALVHVVPMHGVQAALVEVIDMASVADGGVPAPFAVDVRVLRMDLVLGHGQPSLISEMRMSRKG